MSNGIERIQARINKDEIKALRKPPHMRGKIHDRILNTRLLLDVVKAAQPVVMTWKLGKPFDQHEIVVLSDALNRLDRDAE